MVLARGVSENFLPPMIRVFGGTGCGKTVTVRSVLEGFSRYRGDVFRFFYVNLKECRTVFSAGNAVLCAICGRRVPVNLGLDRVFMEIWSEVKALKSKTGKLFICLVLDEVDAIFLDKHFDPSDFFYRFLRHQTFLEDSDIKICLVTITNNAGVLEDLDGRVKSSMGSEMILFPSYSIEELKEVLSHRLDAAFKPGVVEDEAVECCAVFASLKTCDARKAIDLLRVSGEIANEQKGKVTLDCVLDAVPRVEKDWVRNMLKSLPIYSASILGYIAFLTLKMGKISTGELYGVYRRGKVGGSQLKKLSERRVLDIVNDLETVGLISTWNVSRGRKGYGKEIRINVNPQSVLDFYENRSDGYAFKLTTTPPYAFG